MNPHINPKLFTISEVLAVGWKRLTSHFWFFVLVTLAFSSVTWILNSTIGNGANIEFLARTLNLFVSFFSMFTFVRFSLMTSKGQLPQWKDILEFEPRLLGFYFLGALIFSLACIVGFTFFILPCVIVIVRLGFFGFILVEEKLDSVSALKKSWTLTSGHFWPLLGFAAVMILINILGGIALGIGLLITMPLYALAMGYVYEKLKVASQK